MENKFKAGDIVEVRKPDEILKTLDENGTLEGLPFMTEMLEYLGNSFQVKTRIERTCVTCPNNDGFATETKRSFI